MTSTMEDITAENAVEVHGRLSLAEVQLRADLDATAQPAVRAEIYAEAAINLRHQARTWDLRPGRARDNYDKAMRCRAQARLCRAAARIEQLRDQALTAGRDLPDPRGLLIAAGLDANLDDLIALYAAAAGTTAQPLPAVRPGQHTAA
jgi:hypothetical protein